MKIFVEKLEFVGHHGVYEEERREGRRFQVDLTVELSAPKAVETDDIRDTVDYRGLADVILEVGEGPSCHLIEHLAEKMLDGVLDRFAPVQHAELTVRKFATGVPGAPASVGIEMARARDDFQ
jgi:dihydroneopterin aldolase